MYSSLSVCLFITSLAGILAAAFPLEAQLNSWTKPTSGDWEELSWSLGVRPSASHTVAITNAGWKAVAIGPNTWRQYPGSLSVSNLYIDAPINSLNTLLLNYAYTEVPLRVSDRLEIGTNGILMNLYSSLVMTNGGPLVVNGGRIHQEGGQSSVQNVHLDGELTSVLANIDFDRVQAGIWGPARINQTGGTNVFNALTLSDYWQPFYTDPYVGGAPATYNLTNGTVIANGIIIGRANEAAWTQQGGLVEANSVVVGERYYDLFRGSGRYLLRSGELRCSTMTLGASGGGGNFLQEGGTNSVGLLQLATGSSFGMGGGFYALSNGTLNCGDVQVNSGTFVQEAGTHFITNKLSLKGSGGPTTFSLNRAYYQVNTGQLKARELEIGFAGNFIQTNGQTTIRGPVTIAGFAHRVPGSTFLELDGGVLTCNDLDARDCDVNIAGGNLVVSNLLSIRGYSYFCPCPPPQAFASVRLFQGSLSASNIEVYSLMMVGGGKPWHITNSGYLKLADLSYFYTFDLTSERLGRLIVEGSAALDLGRTNYLHFADSRSSSWSPEAKLLIYNWSGSTNGGGSTRVVFGNNKAALNESQVQKILFVNFIGYSRVYSDARILDTGEVVPVTPVMRLITSGTNMIISGMDLESCKPPQTWMAPMKTWATPKARTAFSSAPRLENSFV